MKSSTKRSLINGTESKSMLEEMVLIKFINLQNLSGKKLDMDSKQFQIKVPVNNGSKLFYKINVT